MTIDSGNLFEDALGNEHLDTYWNRVKWKCNKLVEESDPRSPWVIVNNAIFLPLYRFRNIIRDGVQWS